MKIATGTSVIHSVTYSHQETAPKGKAEKKSGKRIGYYYIIIKSLKESQKNDVVKCLYIKGPTKFGFCVIKEGTYGDTKDKEGRDIKDRLIWQQKLHMDLQGKLRLPRLLDSFEENGNFYLVMQHLKGKSLYSKFKKNRGDLPSAMLKGSKLGLQVLNYLLQATQLLSILHKNNYVHRDVTPANFMITPRGKVYVIDMELSYSLDHVLSPPFQLGTYGYMSPQQKLTLTPTIQDDVFSLGAILLQAFTGIHPLKLTDADAGELTSKLNFLISDKRIAELVIQCLQPETTRRPDTMVVHQVLQAYRKDLKSRRARPLSERPLPFTREEILITAQQAVSTLATPLLADEQYGWFSEKINAKSNNSKSQINKAWYASFNIGAAGIIYALSRIHKAGIDIESNRDIINKGLQRIEEKYIKKIDTASPGLYYGAAGIAVSLATAISQGLFTTDVPLTSWINKLLQAENVNVNLSHGIAGQGMACLSCRSFLHVTSGQQRARKYAEELISAQQADGSWLRQDGHKKEKKSYTLSSGSAGIILFLLEYTHQYQDQEAVNSAEKGLQWLMRNVRKSKKNIYWLSSTGKTLSHGLMDGSAGVALTFLKAYQVLKEARYKDFATKALLFTDPQILHDNLSQYNGLSGLGEVYIEAYRILGEHDWLERAAWIAQLLMHLRRDHSKYGTHWLVDKEKQPVANFMSGNSGIMHFLLSYCNPNSTAFPLLPTD